MNILGSCNNVNNTCKNGGTCDENEEKNNCICKEGTTGDLCEIVEGCKNNSTFCGDVNFSRAKCVFDQGKEEAVCECIDNNLNFDEKLLKCRSKW